VVDVTHRPDIQMRLGPLKLPLRHGSSWSPCLDRRSGSGGWTRTTDTAIMSRLLYL
jgi:hypothetical protein